MPKPPRVLIVYNTANDSRSVSGVLKHFLLMAKAWMADGWTVDFLASRAGLAPVRKDLPQAGLVSSDNIFNADRYIGKRWAYFPAYGWRLVTAHFTRTPPYDIIYATSPFIFEVYPALVLKKKHRAILAAKFHHVVSAQPQTKREGLVDRVFLWSEKQSVRWINQHAEVIFANTARVARDVHGLERSLALPERKIHEIGCGIDTSQFFELEPNPVYDVVLLGRIHAQKGVFDLPEIWAEVLRQKPGAKMLIIGEGPHRPQLEEELARRGFGTSITRRGGVPEEEKNRLLAQSKLGLSLSYEEGWGLSVNEYLATGLPVVAYDLPVFREIFPNLLLSVPLGDKPAAARAIVELLDQPQRRAEMGLRARAFVQRYDYRQVARAEAEALTAAFRTSASTLK